MRRFRFKGLFGFQYLGDVKPRKNFIYNEDEIFESKPLLYWVNHENEKISKDWVEVSNEKVIVKKRPFTQTYKDGEVFFSFKTNADFDKFDMPEIGKEMRRKLKKLLNK